MMKRQRRSLPISSSLLSLTSVVARMMVVVVVVVVVTTTTTGVTPMGNHNNNNHHAGMIFVTAFTTTTIITGRQQQQQQQHLPGRPFIHHPPPHQSTNQSISQRTLVVVRGTLPSSVDHPYHHHYMMSESSSSSSSSSKTFSSSTTSRTNRHMVVPAISLSMEDMEFSSTKVVSLSSSSSISSSHNSHNNHRITHHNPESIVTTWLTDTCLPIMSCAFLITANTVGAGCLVMPQLASETGMMMTTVLYGIAYVCNVISGCILATVAITQKERMTTTTSDDVSAVQLPTSLNDFATINLGSSVAGNVVAVISLFINSCVMAFDIDRFGTVLMGHIGTGGLFDASMISIMMATMIATAMITLSATQLSIACSLCVTALFISFGSLLLPGLAAIPDWGSVFYQPGTSPDLWNSIASTFPIILMSMIFQNIVPVVVKQLNYDRTKSVAAISIGAMIPLIMYVAWCCTCLGGSGGVDMESSNGLLITIFSIATLTGSSLCTGMSLAEEFHTLLVNQPPTPTVMNAITKERINNNNKSEAVDVNDSSLSIQTVLPSVAIPLIAALVLGGDSNDGNGLTGALAIAGSFGSPLLYGFLPALMAWRQRLDQPQVQSSVILPSLLPQQLQPYMIPLSAVPALGVVSTVFVGQEILSQFNNLIALTT